MPDFTVLIPTHSHEDTLRYAVASVQWQTRQDFELFIVGDGVSDRTREVVAELMKQDDRIRFFDCPKGQRNGERSRHEALQHASGRFVCYQSDDDLWLPEHLETMAGLLEHHDLAHCMQIEVGPDGSVCTSVFDAATDPLGIRKMERREAGFGLGTGGHRLDAYRKLPEGWMPAPKHMASDLHFWLQFLYQPWCRYISHKWPEILHLSSEKRQGHGNAQRVDELARWWDDVQTAAQRAAIVRRSVAPVLDALSRTHDSGTAGLVDAIDGLKQQLTHPPGKDAPPALPHYTPGEVIRFSSTGPAFPYVHVGFLPPEPWGTWTGAGPAQIVLPLATPLQGRALLRMGVSLLVASPAQPAGAFELSVNGERVLRVQDSRPHADHVIDIPASLCAGLHVLVIGFVPLSPASPQALGLGADARTLGIGLTDLSIEEEKGAPAARWWRG